LEKLRLPTTFTRFGLAAVSQSCILDVQKITQIIDFQPKRSFQEALPAIQTWADQVGVAALRAAKPDLPWLVSGTVLPSPSK